MSNKKSLLQDSLQELENIKNESLELAKEQLINESADLLEKKSAALFEKLISEEVGGFEDMSSEGETEEEPSEHDTDQPAEDEMSLDEILSEMTRDSEESQEKTLEEVLAEIKNSEGMYDEESEDEMPDEESEEDYDDESEDEMSDDEESDDEEMSLEDLRNAAEKMGLKLVKDTEEGEEGEELEDDDIEFDDEESDDEESDDEEFMDVQVDDEVLAENNNRFKNTKVMKNNRKEVLKDLRDVSFNRLVEAYYNMNESDAFIIKEEEDEFYAPDPDSAYEDRYDLGHEHEGSWMDEPSEEDDYEVESDEDEEDEMDEMYGMDEMGYMDEEDTLYELDFPESEPSSLTDEELNEMLSEMDIETDMPRSVGKKMRPERMEGNSYMDEEIYDESVATDTRDKYVDQGLRGPIYGKAGVDESMFEDLTMEELEEIKEMLDGDMESEGSHQGKMHNPEDDFLSESDIEEMISEMEGGEEEIEEDLSKTISLSNKHQMPKRTRIHEEESEQEVMSLKEQLKKLQAENKALNEGFTNKVKSLENKVYDVTISALKAGFVNKFLLEHPLRENEKLEIIHRFSNAQTKEQIKETYISLTNEFAKGQTVKDGSMLNESVQNKVGRVHRTDNAIVTEKNLMNENDESLRFKQLLNYNFGRK
jgi:hypothetical protein